MNPRTALGEIDLDTAWRWRRADMDYATADPDAIATAIAAEAGRPVDYRPVATDGAARAAALIAELL